MTRPQFEANLKRLFPELESLPHADTLFRPLRDIDVAHLEQVHVDLVRRLIRKRLANYIFRVAGPGWHDRPVVCHPWAGCVGKRGLLATELATRGWRGSQR